MKKALRPLFRYSLLAVLVSASASSFAGSFMLQEQNAVQTGDYGAGGAAIAEDASTAWFNSAGLTRITRPQLVLAGNEVVFSTHFNGNLTYSNTTPLLGAGASQTVSNLQGGTSNFIPTFHLAYPLTQRLVAGFSVTTPFGLSTDYSANTLAQYAATSTKLRTIDLSPSLAVKLNDKFSIGGGPDFERLIANFDNNANTNANPANVTTSHNQASDWGKGWHAGLLYQPTNATRFGLAYHSKVVHHATGYSLYTGPLADPNFVVNSVQGVASNPTSSIYSSNAKTTIYLPANTTLSGYHDINNRWAVMGSVVYTQWNIFKQLNLTGLATGATNAQNIIVPSTISENVPQNFRNTWRASVGANVKLNSQWLARAGAGFDETPTKTADRNLRLPDGNRYSLAVGGRYQATKDVALDTGWTHTFIQSSTINNTAVEGAQSTLVNGKSVSHADVIGLQLTWSFA